MKLIHEQLRESAQENESLGTEMVILRITTDRNHLIAMYNDEAIALADMIMQQYIPLPRFEDGEPIKKGDEVEGRIVDHIAWHLYDDDSHLIYSGYSYDRVERPTPEVNEPDSQDKIDKDAKKEVYDYWKCMDETCSQCPSIIDGKKPHEIYGNCHDAMIFDLLRRQRELMERNA